MSSSYEQQRPRLHSEYTEQPSDEPWADLELVLPHNRSPTGITSFVECILVEFTYEGVGAEFVSTSVAGMEWTQFIAIGDEAVSETGARRVGRRSVGVIHLDWEIALREGKPKPLREGVARAI